MAERVDRVDYGDPLAPPGTAAWAKRWALEAAVKIPRIELEPMNVQSHIEFGARYNAWRLIPGPDGRPFDTFDQFCETPKPHGCGFPAEKVRRILTALHGSAVAFGATVEKAPTLSEAGAKGGAIAGKGRPKQAGDNTNGPIRGRGTSAEYLASRVARDAPDVHEKMKAGEFKSVRAAALAAGIVKPADPVKVAARALKKVPVERANDAISGDLRGAKMVVRGLTHGEQEQLYEWLGRELGR